MHQEKRLERVTQLRRAPHRFQHAVAILRSVGIMTMRKIIAGPRDVREVLVAVKEGAEGSTQGLGDGAFFHVDQHGAGFQSARLDDAAVPTICGAATAELVLVRVVVVVVVKERGHAFGKDDPVIVRRGLAMFLEGLLPKAPPNLIPRLPDLERDDLPRHPVVLMPVRGCLFACLWWV